jgi:hypothetical protein
VGKTTLWEWMRQPHFKRAYREARREVSDPTVGQVAALAAVFGVPPSYLVDRGKRQPVLDDEVMDALADETAATILRESARLPESEKRIDLGMVREFAGSHTAPPIARR